MRKARVGSDPAERPLHLPGLPGGPGRAMQGSPPWIRPAERTRPGRGPRRICRRRRPESRARPRPGTRAGPPRSTPRAARRRWLPAGRPPHRERRSRSRSEEHTSELQSRENIVCRLLLEKKKKKINKKLINKNKKKSKLT